MGLLGQPGDQDLVCHLIFVQSSFGIYESSCQNAQEAHNLGAINAFLHCTEQANTEADSLYQPGLPDSSFWNCFQ